MAHFVYHAWMVWSWTEDFKCLQSTAIPSHTKRARWRGGIACCESAQGQGPMEEQAVHDRKHEIMFSTNQFPLHWKLLWTGNNKCKDNDSFEVYKTHCHSKILNIFFCFLFWSVSPWKYRSNVEWNNLSPPLKCANLFFSAPHECIYNACSCEREISLNNSWNLCS